MECAGLYIVPNCPAEIDQQTYLLTALNPYIYQFATNFNNSLELSVGQTDLIKT